MRNKKPPPTFLVNQEDIETIDYNNNTCLNDVLSKKKCNYCC